VRRTPLQRRTPLTRRTPFGGHGAHSAILVEQAERLRQYERSPRYLLWRWSGAARRWVVVAREYSLVAARALFERRSAAAEHDDEWLLADGQDEPWGRASRVLAWFAASWR
jgi:sirohydrochlorin ferrochelatase